MRDFSIIDTIDRAWAQITADYNKALLVDADGCYAISYKLRTVEGIVYLAGDIFTDSIDAAFAAFDSLR